MTDLIDMRYFLFISMVLFCLGNVALLSRKNSIAVLMGIELILNAAALNFVTFSRYVVNDFSGQIATLFIIIIAAAEAVVGLAIILRIYQSKQTIDMDQIKELKS